MTYLVPRDHLLSGGILVSGLLLAIACGGGVESSPAGGGEPVGGTGGDGDAAGGARTGAGGGDEGGSGGSDGSGGTAGTGGSAPLDGGTAPFGMPCDTPGQLACSDAELKLTLICGTSGVWEANGTCSDDQMCDPSEGNRGTCQSPLEPCAMREAGDVYCEGTKNFSCNERLLSSVEVGDCTLGCRDNECVPVADACPADLGLVSYSCATDCGNDGCDTGEYYCSGTLPSTSNWPDVLRLPAASDLCPSVRPGCDLGEPIVIYLNDGETEFTRIMLPEDWSAAVLHYDDLMDREANCLLPRDDTCVTTVGTSGGNVALLFPSRGDAAPRNIEIEYSDAALSCP